MGDEKKTKPSNIFDDEDSINIKTKSESDGTEPCLTSTSLNLAKFIGKCLQIMESLEPVSYEAFIALRDSFKFYLYHVFIWFGVNVHNFFEIQESQYASTFDKMGDNKKRKESTEERKKREFEEKQKKIMKIAQKKYPILTSVINEVNETLRDRKLA